MSTNPAETGAGNPHYHSPPNEAYDDYLWAAHDRLVMSEDYFSNYEQPYEEIQRKAFAFLSTVPVHAVVATGAGIRAEDLRTSHGQCG